jgi:hypothetical protein
MDIYGYLWININNFTKSKIFVLYNQLKIILFTIEELKTKKND